MYTQHPQPPFKTVTYYVILDLLYVIFSILYIIGDPDVYNNILKYVKPFPVWIMIIELWPLRHLHTHITTIIVGLFFGSLGDIFLLFQEKSAIFFGLGALGFLIGHILYVPSFVYLARDLAENKVTLR